MIRGSIVALVTPFDEVGAIDYSAIRRLVDYHVENGTRGIVAVGTTGESPTLSHQEDKSVIEAVVIAADGRIPVIAGAGSNSTSEAILLTEAAQEAGADGILSVVPYYNRPSQEGLINHFSAVAKSTDLPIILYNVPKRTGTDLLNKTACILSEVDNIVGIKDATGDLDRGRKLIEIVPEKFLVYSGDDHTALKLTLAGGAGDISVTANVAPKAMSEMIDAALKEKHQKATEINEKLSLLHQNLFIEPSPAATKWILAKQGLIKETIRLPLMKLSKNGQFEVERAARLAGLAL